MAFPSVCKRVSACRRFFCLRMRSPEFASGSARACRRDCLRVNMQTLFCLRLWLRCLRANALASTRKRAFAWEQTRLPPRARACKRACLHAKTRFCLHANAFTSACVCMQTHLPPRTNAFLPACKRACLATFKTRLPSASACKRACLCV